MPYITHTHVIPIPSLSIQLTKEAYNTKTTLPYEVYTDRIIAPVSTANPDL